MAIIMARPLCEWQPKEKQMESLKEKGKSASKPMIRYFKCNCRDDVMHPLRQLRESGAATAEQYLTLLADNVAFHSPIFAFAIEGKDAVEVVFATSTSIRHGRYIAAH